MDAEADGEERLQCLCDDDEPATQGSLKRQKQVAAGRYRSDGYRNSLAKGQCRPELGPRGLEATP
eukprot:COSAG06_NODE_40309_length_403_cov_0.736842_1_plen_64_part_10